MKDWQNVRLGDVADMLVGYPFQSSSYSESPADPLLLRGDNVGQGTLRWENAKRWPTGLTHGVASYWLKDGDVVLAMDRPWIEAGLKYAAVRGHDLPCLLVQRVARLRGTDRLSTRFLRYVIGGRSFTNYILGTQTGTAVPHISGGQIKAFEFLLPPLDQQEDIASVLGSIDDKIELNRRMNETLEAMAQAIFRDWFVDFGPTHRKLQGATDPVTIMGGVVQDGNAAQAIADLFPAILAESGVPAGFCSCDVGDLMRVLDSRRIPLSSRERERRPGPYPYYGATSVMDYVDEYLFDDVLLLLGEDGSVVRPDGKPFTQYVWGKIWVNNHAHVLKGEGISTEQLKIFFDQVNVAPYVTGAVQAKLNQQNMKKIPFPFSSNELHQQFDRITAPLFNKIRHGVEEVRALVATRDLLLPKLMSGEIRLREAEEMLEAAQ